MPDEGKSKDQLLAELSALRQRLAEFERSSTIRESCDFSVKEAHERLTSVLDGMNDLVYVADMTTYEILYANRAAYKVFGDLPGKICWQALQKGKTAPCAFCTNDRLLDTDGNPSGVYVWEFQNTVTGLWYAISDKAIKWVDGRIVRLEIAADITGRKQMEGELKRAENLYHAIFENSGTAMAIAEEDGTLSLVNREFEKLSGYTREEIEGKRKGTDFVAQEDLELVKAYHEKRRLRSELPPRIYKFRFLDRHGRVKHVSITVDLIPGTKMSVASLQDITEDRRAEGLLRESEKKYRDLVETAHDLIWEVDARNRITFINHAAKKVYGYEPEEVIGLSFLDFLSPEERGRQTEAFITSPANGEKLISGVESEVVDRNGNLHTLLSNAVVLYDQQGNAVGVMGTSTDITERKRTEESLRKSESLLQATGKMARVGGWEFDVETLKQVWTEEIYKILEVGPDYEPTVSKGIAFYSAEARPIVEEAVQRAIDKGESFDLVAPLITALGNLRWIHAIGQAQQNKGKTTKVFGTFQDITGLKKAEDDLKRKNEQLIALNRQIKKQREGLRVLSARIAEAEETERQRIARELHDQVGQNLTALGINLNYALSHMPQSNSDMNRSRILDSLELVNQMTVNIRGVMADLRPPVLDDYGLIAALKWYGEQFSIRTGIGVEVEGSNIPFRLAECAENAMFRIFQEALTNVSKHAKASQVEVTTETDGLAVRLIISDDGVGFDAPGLFGHDKYSHWGILNMSERARAIGGQCHIESRPGEGTKVTIEVPR